MAIDYAKISEELKGKCVNYVMRNLLSDFYASSFGKALLEKHDERDFEDEKLFEKMYPNWVAMVDKYILFGETQDGERVISVILRRERLSVDMQLYLQAWRDNAFWSVFEIWDINQHWLRAVDVIAEVGYNLHSNNHDLSMQEMLSAHQPGDFLLASVVPVVGKWFLSGCQQVIEKGREREIFEKYFKKGFPLGSIYRNNPAKLEKAFRLQKIQYGKFVKYFGTDRLTGSGQELEDKINAFYQSQSGEKAKKINFADLPVEVKREPDVGAVMHQRQGLHFFDDYSRFVKTFSDLEKPQGWSELVIDYLDDDQIPAFVFEEVKEKYTRNFRLIMNDIMLEFDIKKKLDSVDDFEMMMDEFKPGWRKEYPSVHPVNERFRKYYYLDQKIGRNSPCPCGSNKKYKYCCGA